MDLQQLGSAINEFPPTRSVFEVVCRSQCLCDLILLLLFSCHVVTHVGVAENFILDLAVPLDERVITVLKVCMITHNGKEIN